MKLKKAPQHGDIKYTWRFAFRPVEGLNGERRWLEFYRVVEKYKDVNSIYGGPVAGCGYWRQRAILFKGQEYDNEKDSAVECSSLQIALHPEKFKKAE